MVSTKKVLFFIDFDGVICNSAFECFYSSMTALDKVVDKEKCFTTLRWREFLSLRPLVIVAEDYIFLQQYLDDPIIKTQSSFADFLMRPSRQSRFEARELMTSTRHALIKNDKDYWYGLNPLYEKIKKGVLGQAGHPDLFIFSNKKPEFILDILSFHKINWPLEKVLYSAGESKQRLILDQYLPEGRTGFLIDDQIENLQPVLDAVRVRTVLAGWGYIKPEWRKAQGLTVMSEDDFVLEVQNVLQTNRSVT